MKALKYLIVIALPFMFVAGCETVNQNDKALLEKASANAADAKQKHTNHLATSMRTPPATHPL